MFSVQALGSSFSPSLMAGADALADQLVAKATTALGFVDVSVVNAGLGDIAAADLSLALEVEAVLIDRLPVTDRGTLTPLGDRTPAQMKSGLHLTRDEYLVQAKELWSEIKPQRDSGFSNNAEVSRAARAVASTPARKPADDVIAAPSVRAFVVDVAKDTARARIAGGDQEYEEFLVIGQNASGQPFIKTMGVVGKQGGVIPSELGDIIVHQHYEGLSQAPHGGDSSAALHGRPSFVIGADGRTVWEIGRIEGDVKVRTVGNGDSVGRWRDFQIDPAN